MKSGGITHVVTDLEKSRVFNEIVLGFERGAYYEPTRWQAYKKQGGVFFGEHIVL